MGSISGVFRVDRWLSLPGAEDLLRACPCKRGGRREAGRRDRQKDAPSWVSGLAGLLGTACAHVRPGGCRREAGAAVVRGRVRLCWKRLQCGRLRVGTRVRVGGAAESRGWVSLSGPGPTL
jgi:hypothetical protein